MFTLILASHSPKEDRSQAKMTERRTAQGARRRGKAKGCRIVSLEERHAGTRLEAGGPEIEMTDRRKGQGVRGDSP
jgi:hypothetical protein